MKPIDSLAEFDKNGLWLKPRRVTDQPLGIEMGDLSLTIRRIKYEWQMSYRWAKNGNDGPFTCNVIPDYNASPADTLDRIAVESSSNELLLKPLLADRPVVVRPYSPLVIPGRNKITLYVSTPIWLGIEFEACMIKEFPLQLLSETWVGLPTEEGELCYGSQTHARLDNKLLLNLPYRALTPVSLKNKGDENYTLERLSIPAPYLSLCKGDNQLVTEHLSVVLEPETQKATTEIGRADRDKIIALPRKHADKGIVVSTLESLFS